MNDKTKFVFNGWLALSESEREELAEAIRQYQAGSLSKKSSLNESTRDSVMKMQTGPHGRTICACCGR